MTLGKRYKPCETR